MLNALFDYDLEPFNFAFVFSRTYPNIDLYTLLNFSILVIV